LSLSLSLSLVELLAVAVAMTLSTCQRGTLQVAGVVATACCNVTCVAAREKEEENVQLMLLHHAIACPTMPQLNLPLPLSLAPCLSNWNA